WKFQIWIVFEKKKLTQMVLGKESKPDSSAPEYDAWVDKDSSARYYLIATIAEKQQRCLLNCTTANDMWKKLTVLYEQNSSENKHILHQRFFDYTYQPGDDIAAHISKIEMMANQLTDLKEPVSESQIITKVICTLPPSFRAVVTAWDNVPENQK